MADLDLVLRVEKLEETVDSLRDLPERTSRLEVRMGGVEMQIVHLRDEMHSGFSAMRGDMTTMKGELTGQIETVRTELKEGLVAVRTELEGELVAVRTELREDIADLSRDLSAKFLDLGTKIHVQIEALHSVIATTRQGNPPAN